MQINKKTAILWEYKVGNNANIVNFVFLKNSNGLELFLIALSQLYCDIWVFKLNSIEFTESKFVEYYIQYFEKWKSLK